MGLSYNVIIQKLIEKLKTEYDIQDEITDTTDVMELGLDSLDRMNYLFFIEDTFGISIEDEKIEANGIFVIGKTADYILSKIQ
jgi:acyl carrier protein